MVYLDSGQVLLKCILPLGEIVIDFYDKIKGISAVRGSWAQAETLRFDWLSGRDTLAWSMSPQGSSKLRSVKSRSTSTESQWMR